MFTKWKLLLTTVPFVLITIAARYIFEDVLGHKGYVEFSDVGAVLTAGAFLIGFMLAGVMSDYKESEKLPAEVAAALEGMEDAVTIASFKPGLDASAMRRKLYEVTETVCDWMSKKKTVGDVHDKINGLMPVFQEIDKAGATAHAVRGANEAHALRKSVTRIDVISKTGFLSTGYAILEFMVLSIITLLVVSKFKSDVAKYLLLSFITLVYVYLLRLIRDIDDPFEYGEGGARGAAEVDLTPLFSYRDRSKARLG